MRELATLASAFKSEKRCELKNASKACLYRQTLRSRRGDVFPSESERPLLQVL
jgi:hypothetical protein